MESGVTVADIQDVLVAVAPIAGAPRVLSAARKITEALGIAVAVVEELEEEEAGGQRAGSGAGFAGSRRRRLMAERPNRVIGGATGFSDHGSRVPECCPRNTYSYLREHRHMAQVQESVDVNVPVRTAYNQWTQFESFPHFMDGVESITQLDDTHNHWVTKVGGVTREFDTEITEQNPDERIAWTTVGGDTNQAGVVTFHRLSDDQTRVMIQIDWEPVGPGREGRRRGRASTTTGSRPTPSGSRSSSRAAAATRPAPGAGDVDADVTGGAAPDEGDHALAVVRARRGRQDPGLGDPVAGPSSAANGRVRPGLGPLPHLAASGDPAGTGMVGIAPIRLRSCPRSRRAGEGEGQTVFASTSSAPPRRLVVPSAAPAATARRCAP